MLSLTLRKHNRLQMLEKEVLRLCQNSGVVHW